MLSHKGNVRIFENSNLGGNLRVRTEKLTEHVWLMDDNGQSSGYVVVGTVKALVIDTMNGNEDIQAVVRTITDLPLLVVNTHCHPDHIGGNCFFEEVYMHPKDIPCIDFFTSQEKREHLPQVIPVEEGHIFDLGNLKVEVYDLPGHTPGEICLLLREDRILFAGDGINHHLWMQLDGCISLEEYLQVLEAKKYLLEDIDYILHGHTVVLEDKSLYETVEKAIRQLVEQRGTEITDSDKEYEWFAGVGKQHPSDEFGSVICYNPENIWRKKHHEKQSSNCE